MNNLNVDMNSNRLFLTGLLISILIHALILFQNAYLHNISSNEKEKKLEVSYVRTKPQAIKRVKKEGRPLKREHFLNIPAKIGIEKRIPPPFIEKGDIFKPDKRAVARDISFTKPALVKPDSLSTKTKITLPPIEMNKINNPSYISYYQVVREKIKRAAYQNYTGKDTGEITVSFVISRGGILKDLRLIEERSSQSEYLREIALRSVKDASPFPDFPKELDYPNLSFNLAITFELE